MFQNTGKPKPNTSVKNVKILVLTSKKERFQITKIFFPVSNAAALSAVSQLDHREGLAREGRDGSLFP